MEPLPNLDIPPQAEHVGELSTLMRRWAELEPELRNGPFVRWYGWPSPDSGILVDCYGEDSEEGRHDDATIFMAIIIAIEARGWGWSCCHRAKEKSFVFDTWDPNADRDPAIYEVVRHSNKTVAALSAYLQALEEVK